MLLPRLAVVLFSVDHIDAAMIASAHFSAQSVVSGRGGGQPDLDGGRSSAASRIDGRNARNSDCMSGNLTYSEARSCVEKKQSNYIKELTNNVRN